MGVFYYTITQLPILYRQQTLLHFVSRALANLLALLSGLFVFSTCFNDEDVQNRVCDAVNK